MKYGADGYALYFFCLELIAAPIDSKRVNFDLEHDAEYLAYRLKIDSRRVEEIMRFLVDQELFEVDEVTHRITCLQLALRLENSIVKNPELKKTQKRIMAKIAKHKLKKMNAIPENPGFFRKSSDRLDLNADERKKFAVTEKTSHYEPDDETQEIDNNFLRGAS